MPENIMVNGFNINGNPIPYNYDSLGNKLEKTSIAREYSNTDTYNVDDYVLYNGYMYRCKREISVGESFDSTKWTECSVGPELNYIKKFVGFSEDAKYALLNLLAHVAYIDEHGQDYYDELEVTLFQTADVVSISAVFDQDSAVIYDTDDLDVLRQYLTVTAEYEDLSTREITTYTLSGTLTAGTSTIIVSYSGKETTFDVTVTHIVVGWYYPFNGSLLSAGTEDFGFVGNEVYAEGVNDKQCYSHIIPTPGDASTDTQKGLKATNLTKYPNLGGDFTLSFWCKTQIATSGHPIWGTIFGPSVSHTAYFSSSTLQASGWSVNHTDTNGSANAGFGFQIYQSKINFRITASDPTKSGILLVTPPSSFAFTDWHHYAVTRKGNTFRVFVDGTLICTATASYSTIYPANQVAVSAFFNNSSGSDYNDILEAGFGELVQDLFIAEYCKWESGFDPNAIIY